MVAEVAHPTEPSPDQPGRGRQDTHRDGQQAKVLARLVVAKPTWQDCCALATLRHITVARYAGRLVEARSDLSA